MQRAPPLRRATMPGWLRCRRPSRKRPGRSASMRDRCVCWAVIRAPPGGAGNRVLRVGRPAVIDAELAASSAAAAVLPVPAVLDRAEVGDVSAVLLEMLPGQPAADFARGSPGLAPGRGPGLARRHT